MAKSDLSHIETGPKRTVKGTNTWTVVKPSIKTKWGSPINPYFMSPPHDPVACGVGPRWAADLPTPDKGKYCGRSFAQFQSQ